MANSLSGLFDMQGGLTLTICLQILAQVLSALMHLHRLGILHRDLRAANVLLAAMDPIAVMVTDFGVSRILSRFAGCAGTVGTAGLAGVSVGTVSTASVRSYGFSRMLRFRLKNIVGLGSVVPTCRIFAGRQPWALSSGTHRRFAWPTQMEVSQQQRHQICE